MRRKEAHDRDPALGQDRSHMSKSLAVRSRPPEGSPSPSVVAVSIAAHHTHLVVTIPISLPTIESALARRHPLTDHGLTSCRLTYLDKAMSYCELPLFHIPFPK